MQRFTRCAAIQQTLNLAKPNLINIIGISAAMIVTVSTHITFRHSCNKKFNRSWLLQTNKIPNQMQARQQN